MPEQHMQKKYLSCNLHDQLQPCAGWGNAYLHSGRNTAQGSCSASRMAVPGSHEHELCLDSAHLHEQQLHTGLYPHGNHEWHNLVHDR